MFGLFSSKSKPVQSTVAFTVRTTLQLHDREIDQTQYATEHYVVNELAGQAVVYRADTHERYLVDRDARQLKRLDLSAQTAQARQLQAVVGDVPHTIDPEEVEVAGYRCHRATFRVETPQLVISSETFRTRIPGLERTAIRKERELEEQTQPFPSGLAPDEVVVQSSVQILAAGMSQNQSGRVVSVTPEIENLAEMDAILAYKIVD